MHSTSLFDLFRLLRRIKRIRKRINTLNPVFFTEKDCIFWGHSYQRLHIGMTIATTQRWNEFLSLRLVFRFLDTLEVPENDPTHKQ